MALLVEDGTGVPNANTYGTIAGARSYASDRGITLSADDDVVSSQLILAMDYLEGQDYVGRPVSFTQALSWPRTQVQFDPDNPFPDDEIPPQLINAEYQLVIEQFNGINLEPTVDNSEGFVIEDKVDVLLTKFSEKVGTTSQPMLTKVDSLLRALTQPIPTLRSVRV